MNDDTAIRRDFLKGAAASLLVMFSEDDLLAASLKQTTPSTPPVKFGLIGVGQWSKEILATISRSQSARISALCDPYQPALKKALETAPNAMTTNDYRKVLESPEVEAVIIATPTHLHKDIVLAALQAGKHVYCEAPFAHTIDDAKAIASAAQANPKLKFQAGLQGRSNAMYRHISNFIRTGVLGSPAQVISQWNKKLSWRRAAPTPEREAELNWHLSKQSSIGLPGEIGIHQFDLVNWYLKSLPIAVSGFGSTMNWKDGRDVPDTVQCVLEYPNNVRMMFTSTLVSSFSNSYTLFQGSNSSLMLREKRGWMVKEADSALLGWEVYARKENLHDETGICMVADATKLLEEGKEPGKESSMETRQSALSLAFDNFAQSIRENTNPIGSVLDGYRATVTAIKAHEAVMSGNKIAIPKSIFDLN